MGSESHLEQAVAPVLTGSDRMKGAAVYRADGAKVGQIEQVMTDERSGEPAYAVMSCRGGEDRYPLPWRLLTYNAARSGFEAELTDAQLRGAPKFCRDESWDWTSRERCRMLDDYYNIAPG
jgi:hypothetical protein